MKLLKCYLIAASITTIFGAAIDIERTIKQVQNILQENSTLPRLSREEIIDLLNDIRSQDTKGISLSEKPEQTSTEKKIQSKPNLADQSSISSEETNVENNILSQKENIEDNLVGENTFVDSQPGQLDIESTTKSGTTLMVVLPYTPRDGSSLQELYTKPPRTEVVPVPKTTENPTSMNKNETLSETLIKNAKVSNDKRQDFPEELQSFLDAHGLKGNTKSDHFLLPLDGFKPIPSFKPLDGSIELPENILLTYDLISSTSELRAHANQEQLSAQNEFMFQPLRPEFPFELDMSPSELDEISIPYDLPKKRKPKSIVQEALDDESVKVIPLSKGPMPLENEKNVLESDVNKRQTNISTTSTSTTESTPTQTEADTPAEALSSAATNSDTGASISDLEDSFGGSPPEKPGDSQLPPPKKNGFYWMLDWNSFLEVGDGRTKVNIHFEPKLGDPQMFIPVNVP